MPGEPSSPQSSDPHPPIARIADVARMAGVSPATASRALNGVVTVDGELVERVRAAAEELDYRPNGAARSLRRRRADVLALIISDVANPFFTSLARGAEDAAKRRGLSVLLGNSDEDADKEATYLHVAVQERVAGVILSPNHGVADLDVVRRAGIPVCIVDRDLGEGFDTVRADAYDTGLQATTHLFDEGWERPGCITGPDGAFTADDRLAGYRGAFAARRRRPAASLVRRTDFRAGQAQAAAASLLDSARPPDSLFLANSAIALGALAELAKRRLRPGRDIGLVGVDDTQWASLISPPLSVVAQPAAEMGRIAVDTLVDRAVPRAGDRSAPTAPPRQVVLPVQLIARASSRRRRR